MKNPRYVALSALLQVERGANSSQVLDRELKSLPHKDRGFVTELVLGVLRWRGRLDYAIAYLSDRRLEKIEPEVKNALRMGLYQIERMRVPSYAAVKETVNLLKTPWKRSFANAILRGFLREGVKYPERTEPLMYLTHTLSTPEWKALRWLDELGLDGAEKMALYFNSPPPLYLRVNRRKTSAEVLVKALEREGILTEPCREIPLCLKVKKGNPKNSKALRKGFFYIQDIASQMAGFLAAKLASKVWDPCSAPGGKSSHLAELGAEVLAPAMSFPRMRLALKNFRRLGLRIRVFVGDGEKPPVRGKFPLILLDAPCSSMGIIHRAPEVKWRINPQKLQSLKEKQRKLLERLLPFGERILYVVCTQEREETLSVVEDLTLAEPPKISPENFFLRRGKTLFSNALDFSSDAMFYTVVL